MLKSQIDRRSFFEFVALTGALATGPLLLASCSKENQNTGDSNNPTQNIDKKAITFTSLYGTSGLYAQSGIEGLEGLRLVPAYLGGKLLGREVKVVGFDTQEKIDVAVRRARESIAAGAEFFTGGSASNVALAEGEEVNKGSGVFVTSAGADEITGKECRSGVFRWSVSTYSAVQETIAPLIKAEPSLKRWYTITPDYVFGQSLLNNAKDVFKQHNIEHVGNSFHSLDATEFSGYLNNALAAKPDVLCLFNFGAQSTTTIKQAVSFGMKNKMKILLVWSGGLSQLKALGPDALEGVYAGCQYWHTVDTPGNKKFVDLFRKTYDKNPGYAHVTGFIAGRLFALGIQKAAKTDPTSVIQALEGLKYDGPTGPEVIRAEDHQVIKQYYLLKGKSKDSMKDSDDLMEIISSGNTAPSLAKAGCTLKPLGS